MRKWCRQGGRFALNTGRKRRSSGVKLSGLLCPCGRLLRELMTTADASDWDNIEISECFCRLWSILPDRISGSGLAGRHAGGQTLEKGHQERIYRKATPLALDAFILGKVPAFRRKDDLESVIQLIFAMRSSHRQGMSRQVWRGIRNNPSCKH